MTKAGTAANYIFWLRRLKPKVHEASSAARGDDRNEKGPAHMDICDVSFAYSSRPTTMVLEDVTVDVGSPTQTHCNTGLTVD